MPSNHGNPVIVETTFQREHFIRTIDVSAAHAKAPAGLAVGPSSSGTIEPHSYYIVDRAVNNNDDPNIVDGKISRARPPRRRSPPATSRPRWTPGPTGTSSCRPLGSNIDATVTDDGLPSTPPGRSTTTWTQVSGPSTAAFSDASAVDPTVTFPLAGTYVLRLSAYDGEATATDDVTVNVTGRSNIAAVDVRVGASTDDAEEQTTGTMSMSSSKLDMMLDVGTTTNTNTLIGMRFPGLGIPSGATITNAYLQFAAAQMQTGPMALTMARPRRPTTHPPSTSTKKSLSSRGRTTAAVTWNVPSWTQSTTAARRNAVRPQGRHALPGDR